MRPLRAVAPAHAAAITLEVPGATLRVIDGTNHSSVSGPDEFWKALVNGH